MRCIKMRWWMKAAIQYGFAHMPGGGRLYRQVQERYGELANLERSTRFDNAISILKTVREQAGPLDSLHIVELGTGWVPSVPLAFMLAGARVDTFDVTQLVQPDYFIRCRNEIERRLVEFAEAAEIPEADMLVGIDKIAHEDGFVKAASMFGGSYRAPHDTYHLPYDDGQVDLVISNLVLQCIPREVLPGVLRESSRILKPNGMAVHRIWLGDEYSLGDPQRNQLDYLRYSPSTWDRFFNHSIKHLNRLRFPQFVELIEAAGFEIAVCRKTVDWESIPHLKKRGVAAEFRHLDWEDLATVSADIVLKKCSPTTNDKEPKPEPQLQSVSY